MSIRRHLFAYAIDDARACRDALRSGDLSKAVYWLGKAQWAFGYAVARSNTPNSAAVTQLTAVIDGLQGEISRRVSPACVAPSAGPSQ